MFPLKSVSGVLWASLLVASGIAGNWCLAAENSASTPMRPPRPPRYRPEKDQIVIHNGQNRFNRPLYGTNTPFFIYGGDRPEVLLSLPGKGGTLWMGILTGATSKWLSDAQDVTARYRAGAMQYEIRDPLLSSSSLAIDVIPMAESEGVLVRVMASDGAPGVELAWAFGGASGFNQWHLDTCAYCPESACRLRPEDCEKNQFELTATGFRLRAPCHGTRPLQGTVPAGSQLRIADADKLASPLTLWTGAPKPICQRPILAGRGSLKPGKPLDFALHWLTGNEKPLDPAGLPAAFQAAEARRARIAQQVRVHTPDPYINAAVPALCSAADGIWDPPVYVHGGVAWHAPYLGWRGAYVGSVFGWHDRSRTHFRSFARVQLKEPASGRPRADPAQNLARQAADSVLYSRGYIPVHPTRDARGPYDMQQVFIDQLLWHFLWTGDRELVREMWPVLVDHLDWERRCFDPDWDGLYENFANTFISDAHHYSGGGCTQASAYNYRAFRMAARLARLIGKDPAAFDREADKIRAAMNRELWLPQNGWYAEYRDLLGLKRLHPSAELASIYHPIDSEVPSLAQSWQMLRYVDTALEHVPVEGRSRVVWSSNWVPYIWSIRNVCGVEVAHAALANWQTGRREHAYELWRGALVDAMFCCRAPGACIGTSEIDGHATGLCTDFADTVGMFGRSLVEGLFGIVPDALAGELLLRPGLPNAWREASINTPNAGYTYSRRDQDAVEVYQVRAQFRRPMRLRLLVPARRTEVAGVTIDGKKADWKCVPAVGEPVIEITSAKADGANIEIRWAGSEPARAACPAVVGRGEEFSVPSRGARLRRVDDPQETLTGIVLESAGLRARAVGLPGHRTALASAEQGQLAWQVPIEFEIRPSLEICEPRLDTAQGSVSLTLRNNTARPFSLSGQASCGQSEAQIALEIGPHARSAVVRLPARGLVPGTNPIRIQSWGHLPVEGVLVDWRKPEMPLPGRQECVALSALFNDRVTQIFRHEYRSPRSPYCSLQIPLHGYGDWCYCGKTVPKIDDSALRSAAGQKGRFTSPQGILFATPGPGEAPNVVFTSHWDNFPVSTVIPLSGRARHVWFLMAGSTHPMHSQLDNGEIVVSYSDGSTKRLALHNPTTWWPIEGDYQVGLDGFAIPGPHPPRVDLGSGRATVLDLPLDPQRDLRTLTVRCLANEVVVGLMSATLLRP
jgi:hypothetical protein